MALEKSAFLKIAAEAFEAADFLNIFLRFLGFEAHFLIKIFLLKKNVYAEINGGVHFFCFRPETPFLVNEGWRNAIIVSATFRK